MVVIDVTYYPDLKKILNRKEFNISENGYKKVWYMFNDDYTFTLN